MIRFGQIYRLLYINYIIARYGLDRVVLSTPRFSVFRFLSYANPWNWRRTAAHSRGVAMRLAIEQLGPIFVKFGQILSTRHDILPDDVIAELSKLQDQVPPFSSAIVLQTLEQTYGLEWRKIFVEFSLEPFASASIAQVHEAMLQDGSRVVVKIRRPDIKKNIQQDIALLYSVAGLAERFWSHGRRLRARALVAEFEHTIIDELDFMREASNASQLHRNFENSELLYVPKVVWEYTSQRVLVMEKISGISVSDIEELKHHKINLKKLSERGVEIFFTQVFRDSFFHADMHPGNIFVNRHHPEDPQYIAVDFGIMGSLSPTDQHYLAENFLAFFHRDYRRVAVLHIESGWVPPFTRVEDFESSIRTVCEPIFERPLSDISFAQLLLRLFQTASRFKMEVQPQLFLLQKTLLNVEALGRRLYPELNLWETAKPFLERWVKQRYSVKNQLKVFKRQAPYLLDNLLVIPGLWRDALQHQKNQRILADWPSHTIPPKPTHTKIKYFLLGIFVAGSLFILSLFTHLL